MQSAAAMIDPIAFRNACGSFATGVTLITTRQGGVDHGMTANAFMSISLDPPLVAISIAKTAKMLDFIKASGRFAVSILPQGSEDIAMHFAGRPKGGVDATLRDVDELPVARQACAVFCTHVDQEIDAGDHVIFVGRVSIMDVMPALGPVIFHKGKFGHLADMPVPATIAPDFMWDGPHW
jgi:flavin reductase (DIM6/NTAB) family NADH-FMN oxidoreductase RutF